MVPALLNAQSRRPYVAVVRWISASTSKLQRSHRF
jgi:hypothetical protein